jgi:hypothetical protein
VGVTGYRVERCQGSSCTNFVQVGTPTATNYSDTGLSASTTYRYHVRATDAANNNSIYSSIVSATTQPAPVGAPSFVNKSYVPYATTQNITLPKPANTQANDILIAFIELYDATVPGVPSGWTQFAMANGTPKVFTYWKKADAADPASWTWTWTGTRETGGGVLAYRNANHTSPTPFDGTPNTSTGSTGTATLNSITVSTPNSTEVGIVGHGSAGSASGSYWTFRETGNDFSIGDRALAVSGPTGNQTMTVPGTNWAAVHFVLMGASGTGPTACHTVNTTNFSQSAYNAYGAPFDVFQTTTNLMAATCTSGNPNTLTATLGITGDTTRIVYTRGYWYDAVTSGWKQYSGTCTGALNGDWCQGSVSATITDANVSTASSTNPTYLVGMTCSVQGGSWKCGCRDTTCSNFLWQVQGAGM